MDEMKWSDRQLILLSIIDERTECDWTTGTISRYFAPNTDGYYLSFRGKRIHTYVSGSGDAAILRNLERKGYITRPRGADQLQKYLYQVTEKGHGVIADHWKFFQDDRETSPHGTDE